MGRARFVAVLVLLAILPVSPLAFATPIDPSHPGGLYDNADLDDVIEFLCGCSATITPAPVPVDPLWIVVASVYQTEGSPFDPACRWTRATRAPPHAGPPVS